MDYNRYSIDLIKDSFSQYVANGTKNDTALLNGITELSKAIDRAVIAGEDASALEMLKNDLQYITYQLCPL